MSNLKLEFKFKLQVRHYWKNRVQFDDPQDKNYCHGTLYRYVFAILILSYIMIVLRCCWRCFDSWTG